MPNLYELTDEARLLTEIMRTEDLDDEQREAMLAKHREVTGETLPAKLEARAIVIKNLKAEAEQQKTQSDYHARRAKSAKANAEWLERDTHGWLKAMGIAAYKAGVFTLKVVRCGGTQKMELVPDIDAFNLPDKFVTVIPEQRVLNKDALRAALEAREAVPRHWDSGEDADGYPIAKLLPRGTRLSVR